MAKASTSGKAKAPPEEIDTTGMTPEQIAALAEATVKKRKPPKSAGERPAVVEPKGKAAPRPEGRPTIYTKDLADRICAMLAEGKSMRTVCHQDDMPGMTTVFMWLRSNVEFRKQYETAKEEAADALIEETLDIADDGRNDWMEIHDKDGDAVGWKVNGEHVQRSRLRVDTRKWIASKLKPKKYGDKVDVNHGVQPENPLAALLSQINGTALPVVKGDK